jgi:hypothetical protein
MSKLFESRAAVLEHEARARVLEKEIELAKLKASQRTWVGLTEQEALDCFSPNPVTHSKNVEAKLKEKNNA